MWIEIIKMAFESILANKIRSFLSMLGIIVAVVTIFIIFTLGNSLKVAVDKQIIEGLGVASLSVMGTGENSKLKIDDSKLVIDKVDSVKSVKIRIDGSALASYKQKSEEVSITGLDPRHFKTEKNVIEKGRSLIENDLNYSRSVAVIGHDIVEKLYKNEKEVLGKKLTIAGQKLEVVGILAKSDDLLSNTDSKVFIPFTTAKSKVLGNGGYVTLDFEVDALDSVDSAMEELKTVLRKAHGLKEGQEDDFNVSSSEVFIKEAQKVITILSLFLASIAAVSLLVSGVGIMNVMYATVSERTKEIGIAKAIGAKSSDILSQFILESATISFLGAFIGIMIDNVIFYIVNLTPLSNYFRLVPSVSGMFIAVGFSMAIGIFFGYYPARKASRLDPVDALRSE